MLSQLQGHRTQLDITAAPGPTARVSRGEAERREETQCSLAGMSLLCLRDTTCPPGLLAQGSRVEMDRTQVHPDAAQPRNLPRMTVMCEEPETSY